MAGSMKGLEANWKQRADGARARAEAAINELQIKGAKINFNSVAKTSGVSKSFLYDDRTTRERIEQLRLAEVCKEMNNRARYDKTSKSKDVIIAAKDRRIAKLEEENKKTKS
ncbi:MAG: transposase [Firmicutes bacterium]|nr:transposase [Bacillota bacterium]